METRDDRVAERRPVVPRIPADYMAVILDGAPEELLRPVPGARVLVDRLLQEPARRGVAATAADDQDVRTGDPAAVSRVRNPRGGP